MTIETMPFDAAEYLTSPQAQADLIGEAFASGNAVFIAHALDTVVRARGGPFEDGAIVAIAERSQASASVSALEELYARAKKLGFFPEVPAGISGTPAE